jgi:phosphoglycerol transferase MdoB-like AlkP superfamily enzyme
MNNRSENASLAKSLLSTLWDIALMYVLYFVCRAIFLAVNYSHYAEGVFGDNFWTLFRGSLVFDTSAIIYTNLLFLVLALLPLHWKEECGVYKWIVKFAYIVPNAVAIIANLVDARYFSWTERRSTASVFGEFSHEDNIGRILGGELLSQWYLTLAAVAMIWVMWKLYCNPLSFRPERNIISFIKYYSFRVIVMAVVVLLAIAGMRGGIDRSTRPITISNANQYIKSPIQAPLILNTPFSIIRTINKKPFVDPKYYSMDTLVRIYTPLHIPEVDSLNAGNKGKNVVVLIVESFSREFMGCYNKDLEGGNYKGYTPFIDSLAKKSLIFQQSFVNGRKSIDGMPSILSGIPYFVEPFFLTPASLNHLDGLAVELGKEGYQTAFFHGAKNGSMGFEAFANATGFQKYYGRTEFDEAPEFGGEAEFDGYWAIWDEPFLQFYAAEMSKMQEPFMTAVFTASNHHPYQIPEKYKSVYPEEGIEIHKCVRYTDMAIRKFFETASREPWYSNTIFVICSDHTNLSDHDEYQTDLGLFAGPVIFYAPGDSTLVGDRPGIAQQIDVMPTVLGYLGYEKPYISFGVDLLRTPPEETFAVSYFNGIYQILKGGYFVQFDGAKVTAVYADNDKLLKNNLVGTVDVDETVTFLKAFVQQYMSRMNEDRLVAK